MSGLKYLSFHCFTRQQILDPVNAPAQEVGAFGRDEAELAAIHDLRRQAGPRHIPEDALLGPLPDQKIHRYHAGEFEVTRIEKWIAGLDRVRVSDPVSVIADEVIGEAKLEIERGTLVQGVTAGEFGYVDDPGLGAVDFAEALREIRGVERLLDLPEGVEA